MLAVREAHCEREDVAGKVHGQQFFRVSGFAVCIVFARPTSQIRHEALSILPIQSSERVHALSSRRDSAAGGRRMGGGIAHPRQVSDSRQSGRGWDGVRIQGDAHPF